MALKGIKQKRVINIDSVLRLRKPKEVEWKLAIPWYQDEEVLYYSEGISDGSQYDLDTIYKMYRYLSEIGELYFIEILEENHWKAIGDVTLAFDNLPIVIGEKKYRGLGIGKKVITTLIERARNLGLKKLRVGCIYRYNIRSKKLFRSVGFYVVSENEKGISMETKL